jgi:hypothetical protein
MRPPCSPYERAECPQLAATRAGEPAAVGGEREASSGYGTRVRVEQNQRVMRNAPGLRPV